MQLPRESRFIRLIDPSFEFDWKQLYLMQMDLSLRTLVWGKTKDAQNKNPTERPQIVAPKYVLDIIKKADKKKKGGRNILGDSRKMTSEELDAYLKKPRRNISES